MAAILCQSVSSLCSGACAGCGKICSLPCTLCSSVCKPICEGTKKALSSHFCFYTAVTLGLNIPPVIFSALSLIYLGCRGSQWLFINLFFCVAHIVAAFYLAGQSKSWSETMKTLCYDPWIAAYILVTIGFFIWLSIGTAWSSQGAMENGNCPGNISSLALNSIFCGYAFIFLGFMALAVSSAISLCFGQGKESIGTTQSNSQSKGSYAPPFKATAV